jgi:hypothetical protein
MKTVRLPMPSHHAVEAAATNSPHADAANAETATTTAAGWAPRFAGRLR